MNRKRIPCRYEIRTFRSLLASAEAGAHGALDRPTLGRGWRAAVAARCRCHGESGAPARLRRKSHPSSPPRRSPDVNARCDLPHERERISMRWRRLGAAKRRAARARYGRGHRQCLREPPAVRLAIRWSRRSALLLPPLAEKASWRISAGWRPCLQNIERSSGCEFRCRSRATLWRPLLAAGHSRVRVLHGQK